MWVNVLLIGCWLAAIWAACRYTWNTARKPEYPDLRVIRELNRNHNDESEHT